MLATVLVGILGAVASALVLRITIVLGTPAPCGTACWDITISSVSASEPVESYTVTLWIEEAGSGPESRPLVSGRVFDSIIRLTFTDTSRSGYVNAGDSFRLENPGFQTRRCSLSLESLRASASVGWTC